MFTHTLPKPLPQLVLGQTFQKEVLEKARWKQDAESKGEEENQSMWSFWAVPDVHTGKIPPTPTQRPCCSSLFSPTASLNRHEAGRG